MKNYITSPLPFKGQKRFYIRQIQELARLEFAECTTFVDLFGGSGFVSHTIKQARLDANVVWNDYDNFQYRIQQIPQTNQQLRKIREILKNVGDTLLVQGNEKTELLAYLATLPEEADWITLSQNILFPQNYASTKTEMLNNTFYNRCRVSDIPDIDGYLADVIRVEGDWTEIYEQYKDTPNVCFIADPPYVLTDNSGYKNSMNLRETCKLLSALRDYPFLIFCGGVSVFDELFKFAGVSVQTFIKKRKNKY